MYRILKTAVISAIIAMSCLMSCKRYDDDISRLDGRIDRLAELLNDGMSMTYIPEYADGYERIPYSSRDGKFVPCDFTLKYEVMPIDAADDILNCWKEALSVKGVYTSTKAASGEFVEFNVKSVTASVGVLSVLVSGEGIADDFFKGDISMSIRIRVSDGNKSCLSDYVPVKPAFHYLSEDGVDMGEAMNIDGVFWAPVNVGASDADINGKYFTFEEAKSACPDGWRTPSNVELENLVRNYYTEPDMFGYWFSGSVAYSSRVSAVFFPATGLMTDGTVKNGGMTFYWSSTSDGNGGDSYYLAATGGIPQVISGPYAAVALPVRCVCAND